MSTDAVHCRLPPDTLKKLDARVLALRERGVDPRLASRSAVVRVLLSQQLEVDPQIVVEFEIFAVAQRVLYALNGELRSRLQTVPDDAVDEIARAISATVLQKITSRAVAGAISQALDQPLPIMELVETALAEAAPARR